MNINLRKANNIQNQINQLISSHSINPNVYVNEFQDIDTVIDQGRLKLLESIDIRVALENALKEIRMKIGEANHNHSVNKLLTEVAYLDRLIRLAQTLTQYTSQTDRQVIKGQINKMSNVNDYHGSSTVSTSVLLPQDLDSYKIELAALNKQRQQLKDTILEINIKNEITLSQPTVELLNKYGLV